MDDPLDQAPMTSFRPDADTGRQFRQALGLFGTGVTIVTTNSCDGPVGITANSFSSVSLDPPLVLWSASLKSKRFQYFAETEDLAIHILSLQQTELCWAFSKSKHAFDDVEWSEGVNGTPILRHCLARFECKKYANYDGGDHAIIVSQVQKISYRDDKALMFFNGQMGHFAPLAPAAD